MAKNANQRRIDELKRRIDEKDFITKKNPTPIDDELKRLRREKHKVADDDDKDRKPNFNPVATDFLKVRSNWIKIIFLVLKYVILF